jgi:hypothetical protein
MGHKLRPSEGCPRRGTDAARNVGIGRSRRPSATGALAHIKALETRLVEIEQKGVEYKGIYQRALTYRRGSLTTFDGSMFVALRDVAENETPGKGDGWQLAVKRGADARDRPGVVV